MKIEKDYDKMWDVLDNETHTVEISYQENILTRVYFPFEWSVSLSLLCILLKNRSCKLDLATIILMTSNYYLIYN